MSDTTNPADVLEAARALSLTDLRPQVAAFSRLMEATLRKNDRKGGWRGMTVRELLERLCEETDEVFQSLPRACDCPNPDGECAPSRGSLRVWCRKNGVRPEFGPTTANEAADVANFAMMIADVCGALDLLTPRPEPGADDEPETCGRSYDHGYERAMRGEVYECGREPGHDGACGRAPLPCRGCSGDLAGLIDEVCANCRTQLGETFGDYSEGHTAGDRDRFTRCKQDIARALKLPEDTDWATLVARTRQAAHPTPAGEFGLGAVKGRLAAAHNLAIVAVNAKYGTIRLTGYTTPADTDAAAAEHLLENAHRDLAACVAEIERLHARLTEAEAELAALRGGEVRRG